MRVWHSHGVMSPCGPFLLLLRFAHSNVQCELRSIPTPKIPGSLSKFRVVLLRNQGVIDAIQASLACWTRRHACCPTPSQLRLSIEPLVPGPDFILRKLLYQYRETGLYRPPKGQRRHYPEALSTGKRARTGEEAPLDCCFHSYSRALFRSGGLR